MIDPQLVIRKMLLIGRDLEPIRRLGGKTLEEYLSDEDAEILAERYLERIIGRMIDINYHVITESGQAPPLDYHESFLRLGAVGILPADFARELSACAGLRNRIAHEYDAIDPTRIHAALRGAAELFPRYLAHIQAYLDTLPPPSSS